MKSTKRILRVLSLLTFGSLGVTVCEAQTPPVRILPLGDSLTSGVSANIVPGGYRNQLYSMLTTAGYNVDFVGTNTDSSNPTLPDKDHQGVGGARIDEIQAGITGWLNTVQDPDVILLLLGTNDFSQNFNTGSAQTRLNNLITDIATKRPFAKIIVSNLPLRTDSPSLEAQQVAYNAALPGIVNNQVALGRQVSLVDMHSAWVPGDLVEGVHPNQGGYNKMANVWAPAIASVITPLGTANPPAIVRTGPPTTPQQLTVRFSKPISDASTNLANFSLNGGLTISGATLDATSKRIVTLTTSTQTPGTLYTLSVSGVTDRTPAQNVIATGSTIAFSTEAQNNGSFESDFSGWTTTGNMEIKSAIPYIPTNGSKLLAFNTGQSTPNGMISQTFATTVGVPYVLSFDLGAMGLNSQQSLQVSVNGSTSLVSQTVSITGPNSFTTSRWLPQAFSFVANSPATTLTFTDVSSTSNSVDLLLDNVRLTAQVPRTLTVSSAPTNGVNVTLSPADINGATGAPTGFSRQYLNGASVTLSAPAISGANAFVKWQKNGADLTTSTSTTVVMDADYTLNAVYSANNQVLTNGSFESGFTGWTQTGNQEIKNTSPYVATDGSRLVAFNGGNLAPNGVLSQTFPTSSGVSYTLAFDAGVLAFNTSNQSLQVTATGSGSLLSQVVTLSANTGGTSRWFPQTFTFIANSSSTTLTFRDQSPTSVGLDLLLDNVRVTGPVGPVNNSPVAVADTYSTNFNTALVVPAAGVLTNDTDTESNPLTASVGTGPANGTLVLNADGGFTYTPNNGYSGPDSFTYRANDGTSNSNFATVSITVNGLASGSLVNGSFESGETGWTFSGNYLVYPSDGTYVAFAGTNMVVLHGGPFTPNAVISQSFATTPGQTYQLAFNLGTVGGNGVPQGIQVALNGSSSLISQTETVTGTNSPTAVWSPKVINFTADSSVTTLTFTDPSSNSTSGVDLLLDNVSVGIPSVNSAPVAVADSYSTQLNTTLTIPAAGVLTNDTDAQSNPLTAVVDTTTTSGNLTLNANGGFTYVPNPGFSGSDSFTYHANDGSLDSNIVTVSITVSPGVSVGLVNGSFESDETGWTMSGNRLAYTSDGTYVATNGTKLLVLSGGSTTPNAVISQTFATTSGQTYTLTFDAGTLSATAAQQVLLVSVSGNSSLVSDAVTLTGNAAGNSNWAAKSYTFVADSASTTLTFSDLSPVSSLIDLLLDNVAVSGSSGPMNNPPVAVADSYTATQNTPLVVAVASGVLVNDTDTESNPLTASVVANPTNGSLTLNPNGGFTYTPTTGYSGPDSFTYRANDGNSNSNTATVSITVNAAAVPTQLLVNGSFESNFTGWTTSGNQVIESTSPYVPTDGAKLVGFNGGNLTPNAVLSQSFSTVPGQSYTLSFDAGVLAFNTNPQRLQVTVNGTASLLTQVITINGVSGTQRWLPQSFSFVADSAATTLTFRDQSASTAGLDLTLDNVKVIGLPGAPNAAPVAVADNYSTPQGTALVIAAGTGVLVNDTDADLNPLTAVLGTGPTSGTLTLNANGGFTYTPNTGFTGSDSFTYRANDGVTNSNLATVSITVNAVSVGGLANGSFEAGETAWTFSGNYLVYPSDGTYVAFQGTNMLVLNGGNSTPNGSITQTFATTPGQTYQLAYSIGTVAVNFVEQKLQVAVTGAGPLFSQTESVFGNGAGNTAWVNKSYTFTANSAATTLTFTDISTTTGGIDLLLDNVSAGISVAPTAPVAVADTYTTPQNTTLVVAAAGVLTNDTDANSDPLTAVVSTNPTNGSLTLNANGGFTYVPNTGFAGSDSFTYRASDGALNSNLVTVTISVTASASLANGSFENDFAGWTVTGNVAIQNSGPYLPTDGTKLAAFNAANTTPNGVLSQSFSTVPGTTYTLTFDAGALSYNTSTQKLLVNVTGTGNLFSQTFTLGGLGGGNNNWSSRTVTFIANSANTTLSFTDTSTTGLGLDLILDKVKVVASGAPSGNTAPLAVADSYSTGQNTALVIAAASGVLANDVDAQADPMTAIVVTPPASGTLVLNANGGFTYTPATGFLGTATFTYKANDGLLDSAPATVSISVNSIGSLVNGSFENGLNGWTKSGGDPALSVLTNNTLTGTNGTTLVAFNSAASPAGGSLSQSFATTPGQSYILNFDLGVLAFNTSSVTMNVKLQGTSQLVSQNFSVAGIGAGTVKWVPQTLTFTANSASTTLTFLDASTSIFNIDMLLDNVRLTNANARILTVESAVAVNVPITVSPSDNNGATNGNAQFTRNYDLGTNVTLTAPATSGGANFVKWIKDGADFATTAAANVTITADTRMVALYSGGTYPPLGSNLIQNGSFEASPDYNFWAASGSTRIEKPGAASGFPSDGNQILSFNVGGGALDGSVQQSFSTTPGTTYTLQLDVGSFGGPTGGVVSQTLNIGVTGSGTLLSRSVTVPGSTTIIPWQPQTFTFTANSTTTVLILSDGSANGNATDLFVDNVRVKAGVLAPSTLTVNTTPVAGKTITVNTPDLASQGNGTSNFTRVYNTGTTVNMVAPFANFVKWLKNGAWYATDPTINVVVDSNVTMTAVYTETPVLGPFTNGSFESEFTGWTWTGSQQSVKVKDGLPTTDGALIIEFNSNNSATDGAISQTFTTTPGTTYTVTFDMGTKAFNNSQQSLKVEATGTSVLASQLYSINGIGGGQVIYSAKTFSFVANSATTTLSFSDQSSTGTGLDLLLDNVKVNGSSGGGGGGATTNTLTVNSSGASAVAVVVSPADNSSAGNGTTSFTRTYNTGAVVSLTAPATSGAANFVKWQKDSVDFATTAATSVTLSANTTMTAVYQTPGAVGPLVNGSFESGLTGWTNSGNLQIQSASPYTATDGTNIVGFNGVNSTPNGVLSQSFTTVPGTTYTLAFDAGVLSYTTSQQRLQVGVTGTGSLLSQTVTVTRTGGSNNLWLPQSFTFVANSTTSTLTFTDVSTATIGLDLVLDNVRVTEGASGGGGGGGGSGNPVLTVNSTPSTGAAITVSPADNASLGNGSTNFTRTYNTGTTVTLVAPFANFVKWLKNGAWYATDPTITVTMDASHTMTAVYTSTPVLGPFTNGSFESEFTGWTWSGSAQTVKVKTGLPATDGLSVIEFNSNNSALNGVISQTFTTTPGTTYEVAFDMGTLAYTTDAQRLQVSATGASNLLSQTFSINGTGGGNVVWSRKTVTFIADSATTTLTFRDQSTTGLGLDLLLDKVTVTAGSNVQLGPNLIQNGSFEASLTFTGWTQSGSNRIEWPGAAYSTDGQRILSYNVGGGANDGVVSQSFATTIGTTYRVALDVGVYGGPAGGAALQSLRTTVTGSGTLLNQVASVQGVAGDTFVWVPQTYTFVANSTTSTITLADVSTAGSHITDLFIDNVRVTAQAIPNPGTQQVVVGPKKVGGPVIASAAPEPVATAAAVEPAPTPKATTRTQVIKGKKYLVLTIAKSTLPVGAKPVIEVSPDLKTWFSGKAHTTVIVDNGDTLSVRDNTPVRPSEKRFIRLKPIKR